MRLNSLPVLSALANGDTDIAARFMVLHWFLVNGGYNEDV